jgi:alpha-glucosidase
MQWAPGPAAGFSAADPWLPPVSDDPELTVERQRADPGSVLNLFRSLIRLRREVPALAVGAYRPLPGPSDVLSFERWHPAGSVRVHLNFGSSAREIDLEEWRRVLFSTNGRPTEEGDAGRLSLGPGEGVITAR